jgi:hypothetical protein
MTTTRKWWLIASVALLGLAAIIWPSSQPTERQRNLPWQIDRTEGGSTMVFGITLGRSTLDEVENRLQEASTISMFKADDRYSVEAYFDQVTLGGLKAKIVLAIQLPESLMAEMFERGLRMSGSPGGKKITLHPDDVLRVKKSPVSTITYLPALTLEDATLVKRFGEPKERLREERTGAMHWLYPDLGLDIALGGSERPVLQYVSPREFERLEQPLRKQQSAPQHQ